MMRTERAGRILPGHCSSCYFIQCSHRNIRVPCVSWDRVVYQGAQKKRNWMICFIVCEKWPWPASRESLGDWQVVFVVLSSQHQRTATGGTAGDALNVDGWSHYSHRPRKSQSQSRRRPEYRTSLGLLLRVHRELCTLRWIDDGTRKYRAGGIKPRWVGGWSEVKQQEDRQRWWMRDGPDSCSKFVNRSSLNKRSAVV